MSSELITGIATALVAILGYFGTRAGVKWSRRIEAAREQREARSSDVANRNATGESEREYAQLLSANVRQALETDTAWRQKMTEADQAVSRANAATHAAEERLIEMGRTIEQMRREHAQQIAEITAKHDAEQAALLATLEATRAELRHAIHAIEANGTPNADH